ncbi:MAG: hypothetical protein IK097_06635 [Clostridia bacterium]|nr:hypothetical protein [Clostridia bacterium]
MDNKRNYFDRVHLWGAVWNYAALFMMMMVPVMMSIVLKTWPSLSILGKVIATLAPLYWVTGIIEVVTYVPMLGAGGTYLSFVTGNISNLKLPCGLNAMENAKVRPNTEEGEVISTISIAVSSLTTTIVIAVGVLVFAPIFSSASDNPTFKAAFSNVLPALFGALGASYFAKHWKLGIAPIIGGVIVLLISPATGVGVLMFVTIVISLVAAVIIHRDLFVPVLKGMKNGKAEDVSAEEIKDQPEGDNEES